MTELNLVFLLRNLTAPGVAFGSAVVGNRPGHARFTLVLKLCSSCRTVESQGFDSVGAVSGTLNHR